MLTWSRRGLTLVGLLALLQTTAFAQNLDELVDPRSVGRAGTTVVSSDSGAALIHNPGAMIRRSQPRLVLSGQVGDSDLRYTSAPNSPASGNLSGPITAPLLAYHHGNERGTWVLGVAFRGGRDEGTLPAPAFGQPPQDVTSLFSHRYGGTLYRQTWQQLALGGALRLGDSVGVGFSFSLAEREVLENRRIWAGFDGRDTLLNPERDLELSLESKDSFIPGASLGILLAPPDIPLEFALSAEFQMGATLGDGSASLAATGAAPFPRPFSSGGQATIDTADRYTIRTGLRYLGERSSLETGTDLSIMSGNTNTNSWALSSLEVTDDSGLVAALSSAPALSSERSHLALRAAYDYELILGFLWVSVGYSWTSAPVSAGEITPVHAKLGGHTGALGLEAYYDNFSLSFGYSKRFARERELTDGAASGQVLNPFDAGTGAIGTGKYNTSATQVGVSLEISWQ